MTADKQLRFDIQAHLSPFLDGAEILAGVKDGVVTLGGHAPSYADLKADENHVAVTESTVTLSGTVRSWREREEAEKPAWSAPGVTHVKNNFALIA